MSNGTSAAFIWSIAELLRGDYKQSDYGKVILPFTLLRRLDCVLAPTKQAVLHQYESLKDVGYDTTYFLTSASGHQFYNTSPLDFGRLLGDPNNLRSNLVSYIGAFSPTLDPAAPVGAWRERVAQSVPGFRVCPPDATGAG